MDFLNESILFFITILHLIVILFIIITPFTNSNYLLSMYIIIIPFIMFHWYVNNNTCSLTIAEKFIREKSYGKEVKNDECFSYKFIAPIYDFNKNYEQYSHFTWITTSVLWIIAVLNLSNKYISGKITNFNDLMKI